MVAILSRPQYDNRLYSLQPKSSIYTSPHHFTLELCETSSSFPLWFNIFSVMLNMTKHLSQFKIKILISDNLSVGWCNRGIIQLKLRFFCAKSSNIKELGATQHVRVGQIGGLDYYRLLHSPYLLAVGLSVGYETWLVLLLVWLD